MSDLQQALAKTLGCDPEVLADLDAAALEQLQSDFDATKKRYETEIETALEGALNHVPRLLRGAVRKLFGR